MVENGAGCGAPRGSGEAGNKIDLFFMFGALCNSN